MFGASSGVFPLMLIALGFIAIILSFLVTDHRKSMISLGLAGLIVLAGVIQWGSASVERWRWNRRMKDLQRTSSPNMDELRSRLRDRQGTAGTPGGAPAAQGESNRSR